MRFARIDRTLWKLVFFCESIRAKNSQLKLQLSIILIRTHSTATRDRNPQFRGIFCTGSLFFDVFSSGSYPFSPGFLCKLVRKWPQNVENIAWFLGGEKRIKSCHVHVSGCRGFSVPIWIYSKPPVRGWAEIWKSFKMLQTIRGFPKGGFCEGGGGKLNNWGGARTGCNN